ncbi:hypothetical protein [Actinoplanes sp. URMC 104]|uniref:hypothetical protein n=1 Tax=Actinoplanes sp. URMC 104 TaxID=3423409 RepID=UPI003F1A2F6F
MNRRTLLVAGGAVAVAGLTGAPARAAEGRLVFEWARPGGFFFPGVGVLAPPPLAVYDDHTGFADATTSLPLRERQVASLRARAVEVLGDPRGTVRDPAAPAHRNSPRDRVTVRRQDGTLLTVELDGWGDGDPARAYPAALRALWAHAQEVRRRVLQGEPWRPDAVLLATVELDSPPGAPRGWPLPPPPRGRYVEQRLRGATAQAVRRELPAAAAGTAWPSYRVSPGRHIAATWRHLLPHE